MTTFWRNGFWRTSVNGYLHWVEGHNVDRDAWDRNGAGSTYFSNLLNSARAGQSATATFVNPNAECPVCGAHVFFYQNAVGSRVFFDELGPPWPKHPCTDNSAYREQRSPKQAELLAPHLRNTEEADSIERWLGYAGLNPLEAFHSRYGLSPWVSYLLEGTLKQDRRKVLVLRDLKGSHAEAKRLYVQVKHRLNGVSKGDLIFYYKGWLSYFDADRLQSEEIEGVRLAGATDAICTLLGSADA